MTIIMRTNEYVGTRLTGLFLLGFIQYKGVLSSLLFYNGNAAVHTILAKSNYSTFPLYNQFLFPFSSVKDIHKLQKVLSYLNQE